MRTRTREVVRMLAARGTRDFYAFSRKLCGSPKDRFPDGTTRVRDLGHMLYDILVAADTGEFGSLCALIEWIP